MSDVVDVSGYQKPPLDWQAAREHGLRAVYVKGSEGATHTSPTVFEHVEQAESAGLAVGLYHFARPSPRQGDAAREWRHCLSVAQACWNAGFRLHLRIALDLERGLQSSRRPATVTDHGLAQWTCEWITHHVADLGHHPVLYANRHYLRHLARGATREQLAQLRHCPLWLAADVPTAPHPWDAPVLWQTPERYLPWYEHKIDVDETTTAAGILPIMTPDAREVDRG